MGARLGSSALLFRPMSARSEEIGIEREEVKRPIAATWVRVSAVFLSVSSALRRDCEPVQNQVRGSCYSTKRLLSYIFFRYSSP